jgi:hypothetical protein
MAINQCKSAEYFDLTDAITEHRHRGHLPDCPGRNELLNARDKIRIEKVMPFGFMPDLAFGFAGIPRS